MDPTRRAFLSSGFLAAMPYHAEARPKLRITAFELMPVRATERTVWLLVRLRTDTGLTGLGEASDAFGFANTTRQDAQRMETELRAFFELVQGKSPLDIEAYRQAGESRARAGGLVSATAYSALEQALWDLAGQAVDLPTHMLLGGAVRHSLPVYANINRATRTRTPAGFAETARGALGDGFRALKAAPWDGFPPPGSPPHQIQAAVDQGIACVAAMRDAAGSGVQLMVDCHSFFDVALAQRVAARLEVYNLAWYEEPVAPERTEETAQIRRSIRQPMAGGEILFGVSGFAPLSRNRAVDVIMPDVKHCGGLLAMTHIAAMAEADQVSVAPHNPSGPVSTAATVQVCAGMKNFRILEFQWGEIPWRSELVTPLEQFEAGFIQVPGRPGFGIRLNDKLVREHAL